MKESRHVNFGAIHASFRQLSWSQHKLAHSCQGRGQRSNGAINRNKHLFRCFCRGISNLVTPSLTVAEFSRPQVTRSLFSTQVVRSQQGRFFKLSRSRGRPQNGPRSQVAKTPSWASVSQTDRGRWRVYFMDVTLKDWSFRHRDTCQSNSVARVRTTVFLRNVSNRHWHFSWKHLN